MENFKPFLIRKLTNGSPVRSSVEFGIYPKSIPIKIYGDMKDVSKRDYVDQHGDDEFVPDKPTFKAYSMDCVFLFKGAYGTANKQIRSFCEFLANNGMNEVYDVYTKEGRTNVRYESIHPETLYRTDGDNMEYVVFKIKLKVNDPITEIVLKK